MFTVDTLLDIACERETLIHAQGCRRLMLDETHEMMNAFNGALYLEAAGITRTDAIGPFHNIVCGKIKIRKGSDIISRSKRLTRQAGRDYVVNAIIITPGKVVQDRHKIVVQNARVMWMSDGYYCGTDITNVTQAN